MKIYIRLFVNRLVSFDKNFIWASWQLEDLFSYSSPESLSDFTRMFYSAMVLIWIPIWLSRFGNIVHMLHALPIDRPVPPFLGTTHTIYTIAYNTVCLSTLHTPLLWNIVVLRLRGATQWLSCTSSCLYRPCVVWFHCFVLCTCSQ